MQSSSVQSRTTTALHTSPQKAKPSVEEIRRLRLAKLTGEKTSSSTKATPTMKTTSGSKRPAEDAAKEPTAKAAKIQEVIDLCDDSEDEGDEDDDDDDNSDAVSVGLLASDNEDSDDDEVVEVRGAPKNHAGANNNIQRNQQQLACLTEEEQIALAIAASQQDSSNNHAQNVVAKSRSNVADSGQVGRPANNNVVQLPPYTGNWQVATYNLWFGTDGDGYPQPRARMNKVVDLLLNEHSTGNPLWFMGFQEVVPQLSQVLFPRLKRAGYRVFEQIGVPYGVSLAVLASLQIIEAEFRRYRRTLMGRGFYYAHCRIPSNGGGNEECLVATTHLESFASKDCDGSDKRTPQVLELQQFIFQKMRQHSNIKTAVIMGDLNWDDVRRGAPDPVLLQALSGAAGPKPRGQWKDAFLETNSDRKNMGYTYDTKLNPMFSGGMRRRLDRVLVFQRDDADAVQSQALIGKDPLPGLTFEKKNPYNETSREMPVAPSDHFGLVVRLST